LNDEVLDEFVVGGTWDEVARSLREKYTGIADSVRLYVPFDGSTGWKTLLAGLRP
jgi:hypothetical protein